MAHKHIQQVGIDGLGFITVCTKMRLFAATQSPGNVAHSVHPAIMLQPQSHDVRRRPGGLAFHFASGYASTGAMDSS